MDSSCHNTRNKVSELHIYLEWELQSFVHAKKWSQTWRTYKSNWRTIALNVVHSFSTSYPAKYSFCTSITSLISYQFIKLRYYYKDCTKNTKFRLTPGGVLSGICVGRAVKTIERTGVTYYMLFKFRHLWLTNYYNSATIQKLLNTTIQQLSSYSRYIWSSLNKVYHYSLLSHH